MTADAGPAFAGTAVGRGAAFGDVDNDGDTDVLITNNNGPARLLRAEADVGDAALGGASSLRRQGAAARSGRAPR